METPDWDLATQCHSDIYLQHFICRLNLKLYLQLYKISL